MDPSSQLASVRSAKSKAIRIVDPNSHARQPRPVLQQPVSASLNSPYLTSKDPGGKHALRNQMNGKTRQIGGLQEDPVGEGSRKAFDVYAKPFVPAAFSIINTLHGQRIDTPAVNGIDFGSYIFNSIGFGLLPPIPQPIEKPTSPSFNLTDDVIHTHYEDYFRYHLEAEVQSQHRENESYSLYGHEASLSSYDLEETATLSFVIPGLRENSPYVEDDDVIQLRQLRYDHLGRLLGMEQWLASGNQFIGSAPWFPAPTGRRGGEAAPGWTGIIYNGRVASVQRKQEQLLVRARGLTTQNMWPDMQRSLSGVFHLKFNVQFPVPEERYSPMRYALPIIQQALRKNIGTLNQHDDAYRTTNTTLPSEAGKHWLQSMLFPTEADCELQSKLNSATFSRSYFDNNKKLNWEQEKAVESICSQNYGTIPFLISGPPGTGKTKTLVETALQLVNNVDQVPHILFCAPSDPAADILVQRLSSQLKATELLRLNRPSRSFAEVPDAVLPFCYVLSNAFHLPPFKQLMSYRIVVTTCRDAVILMHSRMTNFDLCAVEYGLRNAIHPQDARPSGAELHWTALLIDEAAQAIEPEALIPLCVVAPPLESVKLSFAPLFAMAGDEYQLGPRTSLQSSPLKTSLFARLFERPVYAGHPLARGKVGKAPPSLNRAMLPILRPAFASLIQNYRSHPAILAMPSALFYADTLEPKASETERLASWPGWRGRRWPVLFHSNNSEDDLEKDGGGWYNVGEAHVACQYAASLVQTGLVEQNEVCIMSPFKAQVQLLRKTIRDPKYGSLWNVDVGPTEAFQGLERGVVILCTTRSKQKYVNNDKALGWGIIGMPNKMNVALTRAKFGLIVIGKEEILLEDPNWKALLEFCDRNGLVAGRTDTGRRFDNGDNVKLTRLEKRLLDKEGGLDGLRASRVIKGSTQDDEMWMWTRGMLTQESVDGSEKDDSDDDE